MLATLLVVGALGACKSNNSQYSSNGVDTTAASKTAAGRLDTAGTPANPRAGFLAAIEEDRHILTIAGICGDHPPTDPEGFAKFAASLQFPDIQEAIGAGVPLDDPVAFRYPANVRQRYERMRDFPEGFLVLGGTEVILKAAWTPALSARPS